VIDEPVNEQLQRVLDSLPEKPPRSRLEPYGKFIDELRHRGRTYRDIASIFAQQCSIQVTASGIHDFVQRREGRGHRGKSGVAASTSTSAPETPRIGRPVEGKKQSSDVLKRIAALKRRETPIEHSTRGFAFDADEPLRLKMSS
jgi:hypothetical protein